MEDHSGNYKILIVDDDREVLEMLTGVFSGAGYRIESASSGADAIAHAKNFLPHIVILDLIMPGMDGIETCQELKLLPTLQGTLVVFYSARSEDYSQIAAFSAGADDYIVKPSKAEILVARINALLRRRFKEGPGQDARMNKINGLTVDHERFVVLKDKKQIHLPRKQFEILAYLINNANRVCSRRELYEQVWQKKFHESNRTIDVHVQNIRNTIGPSVIATVKGVGYRVMPEISTNECFPN